MEFSAVDYDYPNGIAALSNITLSVNSGELVAVMGANGAGKSTLVRHMNGLLKPTHGTVKIFGTDTRTSSAAALSKRVGIIFQNPNNQLFASTVRAEVEFGLINLGFPKETVLNRTDWALKIFNLEEYSSRPPMELSGGEKKRLCIALVLAWEPDILILDEPTVGQDSEQKKKLIEIIKLMITQEKSVLLVTHDIEFVWPLQPRVVLMDRSKIIADGTAQRVLGDSAQLEEASVLPPQLVDLWNGLGMNDQLPRDEFAARDWIVRAHAKSSENRKMNPE